MKSKQMKREEASKRNEVWNALTTTQKVQWLESQGHGHCKQANKLKELLLTHPTIHTAHSHS